MKGKPHLRAKKKLGQHFLKDTQLAEKIVDTLKTHTSQVVIEIGPGTGALTHYLVKYIKKPLYLIEIDKDLVTLLQQTYPALAPFIISSDILKVPFQTIFKGPIALIGNFPYNISSPIFFKILKERNQVQEVVCMLQKEVADRICAPAGNKTYGLLSVLLQTFYNIKYCFTVPPSAFIPVPKVRSAIIHLIRNTRENLPCDETFFTQVVKAAFSQRRKMIRNALNQFHKSLHVIPDYVLRKRAEQLTPDDFISLTQKLEISS